MLFIQIFHISIVNILCITIIIMDSDKGKVHLIGNDQQDTSGLQFPAYSKIISQQSEMVQLQNHYEIYPQIFNVGGNKKLNKTIYQKRKNKLKAMESQLPIILCQNLGKQYNLKGQNPVIALKSVSLMGEDRYGSIKRGQFVIIRGPSGGGKTTFLNILGTIDSSTHGYLQIEGKQINSATSDNQLSKLRRQKIGIVFQTFNLLALMSAYENIQLPMRIQGKIKQKDMKQRTKMLLKTVGLSERADHLPSQLSGGQQQRVAIARSLANSPSIILLDQPTGDLDSKSTIQIMNLLLQINNIGYSTNKSEKNNLITIVMVTHNQDLQCYGDRVIFFQDGKIRKQVLNQYQFALDPEEYSSYLNTKV